MNTKTLNKSNSILFILIILFSSLLIPISYIDKRNTVASFKIDPHLKEKYGLQYPVTFKIELSFTNMNVESVLKNGQRLEKITINETDVEGWRKNANVVYVSFVLDPNTEIEIIANNGNSIPIRKCEPVDYYNNKKMAFIWSIDDYCSWLADLFNSFHHSLRKRNFWITTAVVTSSMDRDGWEKLNRDVAKGKIEVASHSATHPNNIEDYLERGLFYEINSSKNAIMDNLNLNPLFKYNETEYVPTWIEPSGYNHPIILNNLSLCDYLCDRSTKRDRNAPKNKWDEKSSMYPVLPIDYCFEYNHQKSIAIDKFNVGYEEGDAIHFFTHPQEIIDVSERDGSNTQFEDISFIVEFLESCGNKGDVWYSSMGAYYMYQYAMMKCNYEIILS